MSSNTVHDNHETGIDAAATSSGNRFLHNVAIHNDGDCRDLSIGGGTAGTANTWIDNIGTLSEPVPGLCTGGPPPPA